MLDVTPEQLAALKKNHKYLCLSDAPDPQLYGRDTDDYSKNCAPSILACTQPSDCASVGAHYNNGYDYYCNKQGKRYPDTSSATNIGKCYVRRF